MASTAYGPASRHVALWVTIILGGVLVMIGLFTTFDQYGWSDRLGGWMLLVAIGPVAGAVAAAVLVTSRLNRARVNALAGPLALTGFTLTPAPTSVEKTRFGGPLEGLMAALPFRYGAAGIQWFAVETGKTPPSLIFEHEYVTGSGKSTQVHNHTVLVWPARDPHLRLRDLDARPVFGMGRFCWLVRRTYKDREVTDPAFIDLRDRWTLFGNADTGKAFLTEPVRQQLQQSPAGEQWYLGARVMACCFRGTLDAKTIARFLQHVRAVAQTT